jgi:hypothetical protein
MKFRKINKSDCGVVGIVVAVLLLGLLVAFLSLIQVMYVPEWMAQREAEHMNEVESQFAQLKLSIDSQVAIKEKHTPIASSITLGSTEMPFFMSMKAYGHLEIIEDDDFCNITIFNGTEFSNIVGIIKYSSNNAYLKSGGNILNQEYIYESGAVIVNQSEGNILRIRPPISVETDPLFNISFTIINVSSVGGKISWDGYDSIPILTEYSNIEILNISDVTFINVTTSHRNAWILSLNWTLKQSGLIYGSDFQIGEMGNRIIVKFNTYPPNVKLTVVRILAQIGPGWIIPD